MAPTTSRYHYCATRSVFTIILVLTFLLALSQFIVANNPPSLKQRTSLNGDGIRFTPNKGQIIDQQNKVRNDIQYKGEGAGTEIYLLKNSISYVLCKAVSNDTTEDFTPSMQNGPKQTSYNVKQHRVDMEFVNSNITNQHIAEEEMSSDYSNYYYAHCPMGITEVRSYDRITYKEMYNGIDVVYYGNRKEGLKYDIVVNPHANPDLIKLKYTGADHVQLEDNHLIIQTSLGDINENMPRVYQNINGKITDIDAKYILNADEISFQIGKYNSNFPLVIDPSSHWITYYGGSMFDQSYDIATDNVGAAIVCGNTNSANFPTNPGAFQTTLFSAFSGDGIVIKMNFDGTRAWATYYGGSNGDDLSGVNIDNQNNILLAGWTYSNDLPLSAGAAQTLFNNGAGGFSPYDGYIVKLNSSGTRAWATYVAGSSGDQAGSIAADASGNCIVMGSTFSNDLNHSNIIQPGLNGVQDTYFAKYDANGNFMWGTYCGGSAYDNGGKIEVDNNGDFVAAGGTTSTDFPFTTGAFQSTFNGGQQDFYVMKINSSGNILWATYYGGSDYDGASGVVIDTKNNVVVCGMTISPNFPVSAGASQSTLNGTSNVFLVKLNSSGNQLWSTYYGPTCTFNYPGNGCGTDNHDNIYILAEAEDPLYFSCPSATQTTFSCGYQKTFGGEEDQVIVKFNPSGQIVCTTYMGGADEDELDGFGALTCYRGFVYFTNVTFGYSGPNGTYPVTSNAFQKTTGGTYDIVIGKICGVSCGDTTIQVVNTNSSQTSTSCSSPAKANFTQNYNNQIACDTTSVKYQWTFTGGTPSASTSPNPTNISYAVVGIFSVDLKVITDCDTIYSSSSINIAASSATSTNTITPNACNSYTNGTQTYTVSGIYTQTFTGTGGCDSLLTINLAINPTINTIGNQQICANQLATIHGINRNIAGIYSQTFTAASGCDSISSITLTVNGISTNTINPSACINYTHNGQTYSASGIYTQTLSNMAGCDSILTINLSINSTINTNGNQTVCAGQSILIHGVNQNTPGIYTQTFTAVSGCDSITNITLTVNNISTNTIYPTACNSYTHNGQVYFASGIYTQALINASGCDSILTIDLTINNPVSTSGNQGVCSGQSVIIHGVGQNVAGIYSQTFTAASGCDSISSITLTVLSNSSNSINVNTCNSYTHNNLTYTMSGLYTQTLVNGTGCDSILTINLTINTAIYTSIVQGICQGQSILIHGVNQNISGLYTQTFTSVNGCDSISTVTLNIRNGGSNTIALNRCSSYTHNGQTYTTSGVYTQNLTNAAGCDSTLTINLIISPAINTNDSINICEGEPVVIHGLNRTTSGVYTQTFTSMNGCDSISAITLTMHPGVTAAFSIQPNPATTNAIIYFTDQSTGANSWNWTFGDISNSSSTQQHPQLLYNYSGYYHVQLIVINTYGCSDTLEQVVSVEEEFTFFIPNTFTPNEDGINDLFKPASIGIDSKEFEFLIFDRWGNLIFETSDPTKGWNGKVQNGKSGNIAQEDTYVWVINLTDTSNIKHRYRGHINIIK